MLLIDVSLMQRLKNITLAKILKHNNGCGQSTQSTNVTEIYSKYCVSRLCKRKTFYMKFIAFVSI